MKKQIQDKKNTLTQKDVDLLLSNPSESVQRETVSKIARAYVDGNLSPKEKKIAEDILKVALAKRDKAVCSAIASSWGEATFIKPELLLALIDADEDMVGVVLQKFKAIDESLLKKLIDEKKYLVEIAGRSDLSSSLMERLVETGDERAVQKLIEDKKLTDFIYNEILETFPENENIQKALLMRPQVPLDVLEKMLPNLSDNMKKYLLVRRDLPVDLVTSLVSQTREKSILTLSEKSTEDEVRMLVIHLESADRLTPNLILRSVCVGDMKFFEYALAIKAGIPIRNARILIYDSGDFGLERLYEEADLPTQLFPAVRLAVRTFSEMLRETEDGFHDHFTRRLVERLMVLFDQHHIELSAEDTDYFAQKVGQKTWTVCPELT